MCRFNLPFFPHNLGTGKSSILERYANDGCYRNYVPTIGIDFRIKRAMISSSWVKLQIWDTAGQRRFQMITSAYYRPSMIIFLVYDVGDHMTFTNTRTYYLPEIRSYAPGDVQIMLVGHKCDIDASARVSFYCFHFVKI
jgi:small GTP-binding protein